jgi:hypothetical protein
VKGGETLVIDYDVRPERGALTVSVKRSLLFGSSDDLWYQRFDASKQGRVEIPIEKGGSYEVWLTSWSFGGSYDLRWSTKKS